MRDRERGESAGCKVLGAESAGRKVLVVERERRSGDRERRGGEKMREARWFAIRC